ncbi:MAG: TonB-dependent receptor [Puniceicoccales bacterium]|jgi:hemoglobin/transferrin/lactoferrin receptor protein|nr:TonB-dependent receptor [Puniceicoccales bacterium]
MKTRNLLLAAAALTSVPFLAAQTNPVPPPTAAPAKTAPAPAKATAPAAKAAPAPTPAPIKAPAKSTAAPAAAEAEKEKKADMTVVVVATRIQESPYQVAGSVEAVTLDDIRSTGAVTLGDTLKYVPGVGVPFSAGVSSASSSYSTGGERGINIRGLEGDRVAILTDGIPQPDDFTHGGNAASPGRIYFDPAVYGQVEIFKTAASSLYGSGAMSGAIATLSTGPEQLLGKSLDGRILTNTVTFATANNSVNDLVQGAVGNGEWAASVVYSIRKGEELETRGDDTLNPQRFQSQAVIAKLDRKYDNVKLEAIVDYYYLNYNVKGINAAGSMSMGPTMSYDYLTPTQEVQRERLRFSLGAEITSPTAIYDAVNINGYWQDTSANTVSHDVTRITRPTGVTERERVNTLVHETQIRGVNSHARKSIDSGSVSQLIQYGIEASFAVNTMDFARVENGDDAAAAFVMSPSDVYRAAVFASDKIALGRSKAFVVTPSLRTDYYNVNPDNVGSFSTYTNAEAASYVNWSVSPGLSGLYKITNDINVYALYAMGTRNPTAGELNGVFNHSGGGMTGAQIRVLPNPDLKEETANNFEIGVQGNTNEHAFRVAGFYNLYDSFIEPLYNTGITSDDGYQIYTGRNLDDVTIYGVEVSYNWVSKLGFQAGVAFSWTKGKQDVEGVKLPLPSVNPWQIVGYVGYVSPENKWGTRLTLTYVADKDEKDIGPEATGSYAAPVDGFTTLDWAVFYRFTENWTVNVGINNITNEEYFTWSSARTSGGGMTSTRYTQPGINGFVSLTAKF